MFKKILIGNNISNIGKTISKNFNYFNFKVSYCGNSYSNIMNNLEKDKFDGLFFFVSHYNDNLCLFMENVKQRFPNLKVYSIMYGNSEILREKLMRLGVDNCFVLPISPENLCFSVIYDFFCEDELFFSIDIADFLIKNGFPYHVKGFYFLCICIEMVIDKPEMFKNFSKILYPAVREKTGSSLVWIERSIRNLSKMIFNKNIYFENYPDDKKLSNKTLVHALVNMYCETHHIKRK